MIPSDDAIYVYGAGGHGRVVADILLSAGAELAGFIDDAQQPGTPVLSFRVVGDRNWLVSAARAGRIRIALGIGDNRCRHRIAEFCVDQRCDLQAAIHPAAVISRFAQVAAGAVVMAGAIINPGARIGYCAVVNTGAVVDHDAVVGDYAQVMPNAALAGAARLGEEASLGTGASMIPAVRVGARSVVGAGAVVIRDVPDDVVAAGVPASIRRPVPIS